MKKALSIVKTVLVWLVVLVAVLMMVFTIVSVNTFDRNDREIFGYRCYIVLTDSMSATDFDAGDLVLAAIQDPEVAVIAIDTDVTYDWGGDSYENSKALLMAGKTFFGVDGDETITFCRLRLCQPHRQCYSEGPDCQGRYRW